MLICSTFFASEARILLCLYPSALLMADSRTPSDSKTTALFFRSASTYKTINRKALPQTQT